ncbi:membrane protein implicated in regulation of membrane protease activity [Erwinia toletana]|uniref:Membrane protein implicated in regulation of membrane protease activity n=1 Tax=Winslowiella toletana TaxID=92490 RepID=A0ABS4PC39_9GAMM|nr:NfeD family protein [Winslowiella toletana]MBP2170204.1 membrane protein implicated in regulation of membrane protease activity [Winslowiella toletana]
MLAEIIAHPHWFWLTLGGLLLAAEMLGTSGYLLWSGISAVLVGLLVWLLPLSWEWQGGIFALLIMVSALLWFRWMQRRDRQQVPSTLNKRGSQMIGLHLKLQTSLVDGLGHVKIGDSSWRVQADTDLPAGSEVVVVAVEGITLRIRPRI